MITLLPHIAQFEISYRGCSESWMPSLPVQPCGYIRIHNLYQLSTSPSTLNTTIQHFCHVLRCSFTILLYAFCSRQSTNMQFSVHLWAIQPWALKFSSYYPVFWQQFHGFVEWTNLFGHIILHFSLSDGFVYSHRSLFSSILPQAP